MRLVRCLSRLGGGPTGRVFVYFGAAVSGSDGPSARGHNYNDGYVGKARSVFAKATRDAVCCLAGRGLGYAISYPSCVTHRVLYFAIWSARSATGPAMLTSEVS